MKLLFIIDSLGIGGKERQLLELIGELEKRHNYDIVLLVLSKNNFYEKTDTLSIEKHYIQRSRKKDIKTFFTVLGVVKRFRPDIIHSWELMCSVYTGPVARITGSRFVNGFIRRAPTSPLLAKPRLTYPFSDKIVSNSFAGLKSYKVPRGKACCIHNGFDFARVEKLDPVEQVRQKFDIRTKHVVGMIARFHPRKHFESFLKSAETVLASRDDVTFVTVGDGETMQACIKSVNPRYRERIHFLGRQNDVEGIINMLDVGVLLSMDEGVSNTLMEYMAQSKPVIATSHGGNSELVLDNKTGFLVPPKDVAEVSKYIISLLDDEQLARRMGRAGQSRLASEFGMEKMVDSYMTLYNELQ